MYNKEDFRTIVGALRHPSLCVKVYSAQKKTTQPSMCVFLTANKPSIGYGIVDFFYKLCEKKIDDTSLSAFMEMYSNMTSVVRNRGHSSTHRLLYLYYKEPDKGEDVRSVLPSLHQQIDKHIKLWLWNMFIYTCNCNTSCPTVADDMILMAYSSNALQRMIDMCYKYSCKWRFEYNASKCAVIVLTGSALINRNSHGR